MANQPPEQQPAAGPEMSPEADTAYDQHPAFGQGPVAMISGENGAYKTATSETGHENMGKALTEMGLSAESTRGKYGQHEPSWIVQGATIPQLEELGKRFGQEAVAVRQNGRNFFLYTGGPLDGKASMPVEGVNHYPTEPEDFYTVLPGQEGKPKGYFQWNIDMDPDHAVPVHELDKYLNQVSPVEAAGRILKSVVDEYHNILLGLRTRELRKAEAGEQIAPHREPGIHEPSGAPHQEPGIHERPAMTAAKSEKVSSKVFDLVKSQVAMRKTDLASVAAKPHPNSYEWHDGNTQHYTPVLVKADHPHTAGAPSEVPEKNDQAAGAGVKTYSQFALPYGTITPGQKTNLLHYPYQGKAAAAKQLVAKHGFSSYYAGGRYGKPDLGGRNYNTGHLMIYDPSPASGGDFGHADYTDAWRHVHELAHALTYPALNQIYGEGRRIGKLGTHRSEREAMRAVHWEWLAAHKQRDLTAEMGIHVPDDVFARETNTVMHDAIHRAVTGKFTEPSDEGFAPHAHLVPLQHALDVVGQESRRLGLTDPNALVRKSNLANVEGASPLKNPASELLTKSMRSRIGVPLAKAQVPNTAMPQPTTWRLKDNVKNGTNPDHPLEHPTGQPMLPVYDQPVGAAKCGWCQESSKPTRLLPDRSMSVCPNCDKGVADMSESVAQVKGQRALKRNIVANKMGKAEQPAGIKCEKCGAGHKTGEHAASALFEQPEPKVLHPSDRKPKVKKDEPSAAGTAADGKQFDFPDRQMPSAQGSILSFLRSKQSGTGIPTPGKTIGGGSSGAQERSASAQPEAQGQNAEMSASAAPFGKGEKCDCRRPGCEKCDMKKDDMGADDMAMAEKCACGKPGCAKCEKPMAMAKAGMPPVQTQSERGAGNLQVNWADPDNGGWSSLQHGSGAGAFQAGSPRPADHTAVAPHGTYHIQVSPDNSQYGMFYHSGERNAQGFSMPEHTTPTGGLPHLNPKDSSYKGAMSAMYAHHQGQMRQLGAAPAAARSWQTGAMQKQETNANKHARACGGRVTVVKSEQSLKLVSMMKAELFPKSKEPVKAPGSGGSITAGKKMAKGDFGTGAAPGQPAAPKVPAPSLKPMAPPKAPALKPAGIPGAPKTPSAPGMTKAAMNPGGAKEGAANASFQAGTSTAAAPIEKAVPKPPSAYDQTAFRPASPGAGGVPAGQGKPPQGQSMTGKLPIASLTRVTNVPPRK